MSENVEGLEPRVVRFEANVTHLMVQNAEIKADLRALGSKVDERFTKVDEQFTKMLEKLGDLKVWVLTVVGGGVLSILARALHWV